MGQAVVGGMSRHGGTEHGENVSTIPESGPRAKTDHRPLIPGPTVSRTQAGAGCAARREQTIRDVHVEK